MMIHYNSRPRFFVLASLFFLMSIPTLAQEKYWVKPDSLYKYVQPSSGEKAQFTPNGPLETAQSRLSFMARRARLGFSGKPYKGLTYAVMLQYDNLGKDKLSGVRGATNTGTLGILDAYVTWRFTKNEMGAITAGYFQPQISRECITGDLLVNSFDKSVSQAYIRQHMDGKGYGRATGLNIGGLKSFSSFSFSYNAGVFNNVTTAADPKDFPESAGKNWAPLTVERLTFTFGDAEKKTYSINYDANNYYSKRKGITVGVFGSQQGRTDIFQHNHVTGFDVLFNYKNLNLDGEWAWLERKVEGNTLRGQTGHIRAGYNIVVSEKYFLEPCFMLTDYSGNSNGSATGSDRLYDAGVNWYLNKKNCKLSVHYIVQEGAGVNGYTDGVTFQKGNYAGASFVLMI
jgi:hypothetical protein